MAKDLVSIKIDYQTYQKIKDFYLPYKINIKGEYIDFVSEYNSIVITGYLSKKENKSITFKGKSAIQEASKWGEIKETPIKNKEKEHWLDYEDQIGSDEVGVGDFLLPIIVVASFIKESDIKRIKSLGVNDSKKLTDEKILKLGEELIKFISYSKLTLPNEKYNALVSSKENLNSIKAKMHNRALLNMHKKYLDVTHIYVDQFVNEKKYYSYLNDENEEQVKDIVFKTKGESYFPSVATSSVIARYYFLKEKEKLDLKYNKNFPFGASEKVNKFSSSLIKEIGLEEFKKIAKLNFKNYKELITETK